MQQISRETSLFELAALVSEKLSNAGIIAVLSGGSAVSAYTDNQYQSVDLDFVTAAGLEEIGAVLSPLGFERGSKGRARYFEHPECRWYVEFPPAPLSVGSKQIRQGEWAQLETDFGVIQILTQRKLSWTGLRPISIGMTNHHSTKRSWFVPDRKSIGAS